MLQEGFFASLPRCSHPSPALLAPCSAPQKHFSLECQFGGLGTAEDLRIHPSVSPTSHSAQGSIWDAGTEHLYLSLQGRSFGQCPGEQLGC